MVKIHSFDMYNQMAQPLKRKWEKKKRSEVSIGGPKP
jgi:hypothetical protein